ERVPGGEGLHLSSRHGDDVGTVGGPRRGDRDVAGGSVGEGRDRVKDAREADLERVGVAHDLEISDRTAVAAARVAAVAAVDPGVPVRWTRSIARAAVAADGVEADASL